MMNKKHVDLVSVGVVVGIIIPIILVLAFIIYYSSRFDSIFQTATYFQHMHVMYKILSVSLMPGVGLFFLWTKQNKINQARGALLATLFYGIFVLILYMS